MWVYTLLKEATSKEVMQEVDTYVYRRHNTVDQFIVTRPIMDLSLAEDQISGTRVSKQRWEQDRADVKRMWVAAWEADRTEGG